MASLTGGEALVHVHIDEIIAGLVARKNYIFLCSNALLLEEKLQEKSWSSLNASILRFGPRVRFPFGPSRPKIATNGALKRLIFQYGDLRGDSAHAQTRADTIPLRRIRLQPGTGFR